MKNLSLRGKNMPASPIRRLTPYANIAKDKGLHVLHLNIGQPDIPLPKEVSRYLFDGIKDNYYLPYSPSEGLIEYREKLSIFYKKMGLDVLPSDIMVTTGGSEALFFVMMTLCDVGDNIITFDPCYANYMGFSAEIGVELKAIKSELSENFNLPNNIKIEEAITSKTKGILLCNPNNPTGHIYTKEELERLLDLCIKHNLYLISDEVYSEFLYTGNPFFSTMQLPKSSDRVILLDSVSKRYNLCGVRIGMIVCRNRTFMEVILKYAQARLSPPILGQKIAISMLNLESSYFDNLRIEYKKRRDIILSGLSKIEGVSYSNPDGAFYIIASLPVNNAEDFIIWMLSKFEYKYSETQYTLMLAPLSGFYVTPNQGLNEVRIAYVLNSEELAISMLVLKEALTLYKQLNKENL